MFEHSAKVPAVYKTAAGILRRASEKEGPVLPRLRPLLEVHSRRINRNRVFALLAKTIGAEAALSEFFREIDLFRSEPRLDPWLARILFTELVWGEKSPAGESKPVRTAIEYYERHKDRLSAIALEAENAASAVLPIPRYVRINTLRLSAADAVRHFQDEGWNLVRCTSGSYDDYLKQIENLREDDFVPDYHVKIVFAFPAKTSFADSSLYHNGELFLQDKATCLAGLLLSPTPGSNVLDMCAAPGMKTTHLASIMKNEGIIYSVEQDEERCKVLKEFVEKSGATCVKVINKDVLTVTKADCPSIDYVLLDPSCSGSGIKRVVEDNDPDVDFQSGRLEKLSRFQAKLLRHALNEFRSAKRIVYSTCSIYPQENEEVVEDVLRNHRGRFRLVSAKELLRNNWNNIGDLKYRDIGEKCIYARSETDYTIGFFIAVFEQDIDYLKESKSQEKQVYEETQSKINQVDEKEKNKGVSLQDNDENESIVKPEKVKKRKMVNVDDESQIPSEMGEDRNIKYENDVPTSKKNKIKHVENVVSQDDDNQLNLEKKIKKKKRKTENSDLITDIEVVGIENDEMAAAEKSTVPNNCEKTKKKKKGAKSSEIEEGSGDSNCNVEIPESKKKKKSKGGVDIEDVSSNTKNEDGNDEESGSKRKKKDKTTKSSEIEATIDLSNEDESMHKKKKKKRKYEEVNNQEDCQEISVQEIDCDESINNDSSLKKAKKKKKDK